MDLASTVTVLEGLVYITGLIFFAASVWGLWKLTENKRADVKVIIFNETDHEVKVRCPGRIRESMYEYIDDENSDWEPMQRRGIREFTFRGSLFGTPTLWCYVEVDPEFPAKRFRIYKSGDHKDEEVICRLTKDGAYVDDVLRPGSWAAEIEESHLRTKHDIISKIKSSQFDAIVNADTDVTGRSTNRANTDDRVQFEHDKGVSVPLLKQAVEIPLRCNNGRTVRVHYESALLRMAPKLSAKVPHKLPSPSKKREIFLRMVNSDTLNFVSQWCDKYKDDPQYNETNWKEPISQWDGAYLAPRSYQQLLDITQAASYLGLNRLSTAAMGVAIKRYFDEVREAEASKTEDFLRLFNKAAASFKDVNLTIPNEPSTSRRNLSEDDVEAIADAFVGNSNASTTSEDAMNSQGQASTYKCIMCNYTARSRGLLFKHALRDHLQDAINESSEGRSNTGNDQTLEAATNEGNNPSMQDQTE